MDRLHSERGGGARRIPSMIKTLRLALLSLALSALVATAGAAAPGGPKGPREHRGGPPSKPLKVKHVGRGDLYCPSAALVFGNVIVQSGRCYALFVMRDAYGTFLAFGPRGIPPGQLVRLNTPAGAKVRGRIFYLVPLHTTAAIVPMNTISLVAVRAEDFGPRVAIVLTGVPAPNVTVVFDVRV
jgi:hypothetical protein